MTVLFSDQQTNGGRFTANVYTFPCYGNLILQVHGPQTLYVASDQQQLLQDSSAGRQGLQITQAMGLVQLQWKGDLWISGSAPGSADFQLLGS